MYFLLSPAKNLNEKTPAPIAHHGRLPVLLPQAATLMDTLKTLDAIDLQELMDISGKIAETNVLRNQAWHPDYAQDSAAKASVYLFDGDAYKGLDAYHLDANHITYLEQHLGILSGLYGLLRPLDMMLPYRLEMGTKLKTAQADDLYQFWGDTITNVVNEQLANSGSDILINTASNEYFSAINPKKLNARIITPRFEDYKNGSYKVISFYAKRARGLMVRYAALNHLSDFRALKDFDLEGYYFVSDASDDNTWVFRRDGV